MRWHDQAGQASTLDVAFSTVASSLLAASLGAWRRSRRDQLAALEERNRLLAIERDQQAAVGAAIERARIARELHDVVAHSLSVIVVQADGAAAGAEQRPGAAVAALRTIGDTGRDALAQMRRLLGVLRGDERAPDMAPQPGAAELGALVAQVVRARAARCAVGTGRGAAARSARSTSRVYRVVQEALTNVLKHAGDVTRVEVVLRYGDGRRGARRARRRASASHAPRRRPRPRAWPACASASSSSTARSTPGRARSGGFQVRAVIPAARVEAAA